MSFCIVGDSGVEIQEEGSDRHNLMPAPCNDEDEEDDEDECFEAILMPLEREKEFEQFFSWMTSVDGKSKSPRCARQHVRQVQSILSNASQGWFNLDALLDRKALRDLWLTNFEKRRQPGTVKSYLNSLRYFYRYCLCDSPVFMTGDIGCYTALVTLVTNWLAVYQKKSNLRKWETKMTQLGQLITANDMKLLDASEPAQRCRRICSELKASTSKPSLKDFCLLRDYIITNLCLDNASRTGALSNMTLGEFENSSPHESGTQVRVLMHKTVATSGPAILCFTASLKEATDSYVYYCRNKLEGIGCEPHDAVFVSWCGNKMSSSMITSQLNSFWNRSVGKNPYRLRMHATLIRKSAVTAMHNKEPQLEKPLAGLMGHQLRTAKSIYYLDDQAKSAAHASGTLRGVLRGQHSERTAEDCDAELKRIFRPQIACGKIDLDIIRKKRKFACHSVSSLSEFKIRDRLRNIISSEKASQVRCSMKIAEESSEGSGDVELSAAEDRSSPEFAMSKTAKRCKFSDEDSATLVEEFKELIWDPSSVIKRSLIFEYAKSHPAVNNLISKYSLESILWKVRTEKKKLFS